LVNGLLCPGDDDEEEDEELVGLEGASLPPDCATFLPLPLATKVAQVIPPYRSHSTQQLFVILSLTK
jgi:hypothetical protein